MESIEYLAKKTGLDKDCISLVESGPLSIKNYVTYKFRIDVSAGCIDIDYFYIAVAQKGKKIKVLPIVK